MASDESAQLIVPESLLRGKSSAVQEVITENYLSYVRMKDHQAELAVKASNEVDFRGERPLCPLRRLPAASGKEILRIRIPKVFSKKEATKGATKTSQRLDTSLNAESELRDKTAVESNTVISAVHEDTAVESGGAPSEGRKGFEVSLNSVLQGNPTTLSKEEMVVTKRLTSSERIGALFTPTANVRTEYRNRQIEAREFVPSVLPVPNGSFNQGKKQKSFPQSHFLRYDAFVDTKTDPHSPEEWVSLGAECGGTPARTRFFDSKGNETWRPCRVRAYDPERYLFTVEIEDVSTPVTATRLNIIFDNEDEEAWKARVAEAMVTRDEAEARMRYRMYVESIPDRYLAPADEDQLDRILGLVGSQFRVAQVPLIEGLVEEVRAAYKWGLQNAYHRYNCFSLAEQERLSDLDLPSPPSFGNNYEDALFRPCGAIKQSLTTIVATVGTPSLQFCGLNGFLGVNLIMTHPLLLQTTRAVQSCFSRYYDCLLIDAVLATCEPPCEPGAFGSVQTARAEEIVNTLNSRWVGSVLATIQNDLDAVFDFRGIDLAQYKQSRMCRFFRLINCIMRAQLRDLMLRSLDAFWTLLEPHLVCLPKDWDSAADIVEVLPEDAEERAHWEMRAHELIEARKKELEDERAAQALAKAESRGGRKGKKAADAAAHLIDETEENQPELTAEDVLEFPFTCSILPYSARILYLAHNGSTNQPLFVLQLLSIGDRVRFEPSLNELENHIKGTVSGVFDSTDKVRGVEDQLFPLLNLEVVYLRPLARTDLLVNYHTDRIAKMLNEAMKGPQQVLEMYKCFDYILDCDLDSFIDSFETKKLSLQNFSVTLERLSRDIGRIRMRTLNEIQFELVLVVTTPAKEALIRKASAIMGAVCRVLVYQVDADVMHVAEAYKEIHEKLDTPPKTPEELNELHKYVEKLPASITKLERKLAHSESALDILHNYKYMIPTEQFINYWSCCEWPRKIGAQLEQIEFKCKEYRGGFIAELQEKCEALMKDIEKLTEDVNDLVHMTDEGLSMRYHEHVMDLDATFNTYDQRIHLYNSQEALFSLPPTNFAHICEVRVDFIPFKDLWETWHRFSSYSEGWMTMRVDTLDVAEVDSLMQQWTVKTVGIIKALQATHSEEGGVLDVAKHLKEHLDEFRPFLPLMVALTSNLQQSHWKQILTAVGKENLRNFTPEGKCLRDFLKLDMMTHLPEIEEVAENARKTYALERDLYQMETEWKKLFFELEPFGQTYRVKASEIVQQILDEHILRTQSLLGKPLIRQGAAPGLAAKAQNWQRMLDRIQCTMDQWFKCQVTWVYLEPIFSSADISKAMPEEARKFATITASWVYIMDVTRSNPVITSRCMDESLLRDLEEHNRVLEDVLRKLHAFLETKRMAFPRFYFISNEELLQILSDSKDPFLVQPYLSKCFEGIKRIHFEDNFDIVAMESAEQEVVPFVRSVNPKDFSNQVELWLGAVEAAMQASIREQLRLAREDYIVIKRTDFIKKWPGQCVIAICSHFWTMEATDHMDENGTQGLIEFQDECTRNLDDLILLVRDRNLTPVETATLEALVVIEVHARDVIAELAEKCVSSSLSFDWLAQLRYYWSETDHLEVCQINATMRYGYEYLGNTGRLVITQLTDRCYRTLMGALQLNYGGAPEGPAGTGKTETTKDLAKALGKYCVVYNCTDQITAKDMAKLFKGLAQSGSWGCFDEFNRIEIQVLSVIAQQVATIQDAIVLNKTEFFFEGAQMRLTVGCAVFITMNPGYAGRAELPDNLKALFRPVAMMVPNYAMIGQIQLFSYGFFDGKNLAEKIVATYRLCSEQLSSQDHYDYGMRAVKAVLTAAGRLKRQFPDEDESVLMLRSIQDVNVPKFLAQDVELFRGIISDLFPGVTLPEPDYGDLTEAMTSVCAEMNLQPTKYFFNKCFETYEMIIVRHGMMLVGMSFGSKTSVLRALSEGLTVLSYKQLERKTARITINPKSITMGQLYGYVDQSGEWTDGILSSRFRTCASDTTGDRKWLVLDGPVDAVWIENMNTVLDDNKKLCLQNGDIIAMSKAMNMIFEVQDLAHASPATVSRCGMVYVEPETMGWEPLMTSYSNVIPAFIKDNEAAMNAFTGLVDWVMSPMLEFVRKHCTTAIPQGKSTAVSSFTKLFGAAIRTADPDDDTLDSDPIGVDEKNLRAFTESNFLFALVWSVGGCLYTKDRVLFDAELVRIITTDKERKILAPLPADKRSFFDGCYEYAEGEVRFTDWQDMITDVQIPEDAEYQSIIVPTPDMVKYSYIVRLLINAQRPSLLVGDTGTGKTVMVKEILSGYPRSAFVTNTIQFSAQTTAANTQKQLDSKCERRRKGVYGPPPNMRMLILIDDVNMPALEEYGAQPPIELLRQWHDTGGWYNHGKDNLDFRTVEDMLFIVALGPPGGGRNPLTPRYTRHYNALAVPAFEEKTLKKIFNTIMDWIICKGYPAAMRSCAPQLVDATCMLYEVLVGKLKPTPEKSHYTFNLRDISKVFQGISMASTERLQDPMKLYSLWVHEVTRVFADRFVDQSDSEWFATQLSEVTQSMMRTQYRSLIPADGQPLVFTDVMNNREQYELVDDMDAARCVLEEKLNVYNATTRIGRMELVIFNYVIEHVARISRILKQPQGNALLVGVGGSGRHCCTRLAAYCLGHDYATIYVSKGYKRSDFHDNVRAILLKSGGPLGQSVTFCLSDTQIIESSFLEDICNLLNTGEVPGLFETKQDQEQFDNVIAELKDVAPKDASKETLQLLFVQRCRKYLHVVLCFSPIGRKLRDNLRQFPSLVNCTTIDWFRQWPKDGLNSVASRFLEDIEGLSEDMRNSIRICFVAYHEDVKNLGEVYLTECRQRTYVTPTSYLELLKSFSSLLCAKREELQGLRSRYDGGLSQLRKTEDEVAVMKEELAVMLPKLEEKAKQTEVLIAMVEKESAEAEIVKSKVAVEEQAANKTAAKAKEVKDRAQEKVDEATPKLEAAKRAAESLDNAALAEVKQTKKVMEGSVPAVVIEGLCKMLGAQYIPKPVRDPLTGKVTHDYFGHAVRTLMTASFKSTLTNFANDMDKHATDQNIAAVEKMLSLPSFEEKTVARASMALLGISNFIKNMVEYYNMNKIVKPLLAEAAAAEEEFTRAMEELSGKKEQLRIITEQLEEKEQQLRRETDEQARLRKGVEDTQTKISRAVKLIEGLGGEKVRYIQESERYAKAYDNVVGDVVLASGIVAYLGPFQSKYRQQITSKWSEECKKLQIPFSEGFTLEKFLGDPILIQNWKLQQLPSDSFSIDNAIMLKNSLCFPLMIDPQQQANQWIKNMERDNGLRIVRASEPGYTRVISECVRDGLPCLLENVEEELDAQLENLLLRNLLREGNVLTVTIDEPVEWNPNFRFYITTKLPRPHYQPEVSTKVALINFLITEGGLQDQLLQKVMMSERRDVEEKKQQMTIEAAHNKASLKETEDTILRLLSSEGSLLDDEAAITELDRSKHTSDKVAARQLDIEEMDKISERTRQQFVGVAHVGARLFFCVAELANIDPMYQYSLQFYINLFQAALSDSEPSEEVEERIENIINTFQKSLYRNICRSLFVKDQLLFSFIMCLKLLNEDVFLIRWLCLGGLDRDTGLPSNACKEWLPDLNWKMLWRANTQLPSMKDLLKVIKEHEHEVSVFYDALEPLEVHLPPPLSELKDIERLIFVRCLRPDKLVPAVSHYVESKMGRFFVEAPLFNLEQVVEEVGRDPSTTIIFVLSAGADPNAELDRVAALRGMDGRRLTKLSLGQGQDVPARILIEEGRRSGHWVLLQNCHLHQDFMGELSHIIESYSRDDVKLTLHKDFRLWLTSLPSDAFPVSILQNGVKLVQEPPKGLKNNMLRSYTSDPIANPEFFDTCEKPREFKQLLFGLVFFHSIVQERRRFGPLGWNIPYEFNDTDMRISVRQLHIFLNENDEISFDALSYLVGQCNYGGRVTDDWDRRCLVATLAVYLNEMIIEEETYSLCDSYNEYYIPTQGEHSTYVEYINSLPMFTKPEVFGLNANADISKDERDARMLIDSVLATQPREAGGSAMDPKKVVSDTAKEVYSRLAPPFDTEDVQEKYPITYFQSMNTVLLQELIRFNRLIVIVRNSLFEVQRAIKGEIVMSSELEQVFDSIYNSRIPPFWRKRSYPSLKPFGAYIDDLIKRIGFLRRWIDEGLPSVFWVSGFFFTQSFFTGIMQNFARKHKIEIDQLTWEFSVLAKGVQPDVAPEDGCYIHGLFLEGAGWSSELGILVESTPKEIYLNFPVLYLKPVRTEEEQTSAHYRCPTYKTTDRRGVLSTTGHSTNFIMVIKLPRGVNDSENHWVLRGTALFTQLEY